MDNRFDYNEQELMNLLSTASTDEEKKAVYDSYQEKLLSERKNEIINRLNECAKENPMITQEKYVEMLKKYSNDNLQIPFASIVEDINKFDAEMKEEYNRYLESKKTVEVAPAPVVEPTPAPVETPVIPEPEVEITPDVKTEEAPVNIEINPGVDDDIVPDVTPFSNTVEANPIFDDNQKEVAPNDSNDGQKGNANAIIISIITIIIGIVIMYSIIRLK
jgi:hypothetical protein